MVFFTWGNNGGQTTDLGEHPTGWGSTEPTELPIGHRHRLEPAGRSELFFFGQAAMPSLRERFEKLGYSDRELQACRLAAAI